MILMLRAILIATALGLAMPASAQTQAQQDRLDLVGRYLVTAPMCEKLGMTLDPDLPTKAEAALDAETRQWAVEPATIERLKVEAVSRQERILSADLTAASGGARTDAQLRALKDVLLGYALTCNSAAADPVFSTLITAPPGWNPEGAAVAATDNMLEAGGLASWQTPEIQARGDLMMLAGTCRLRIGAKRSDELVRQYGQSDDPKVRDYYSHSFDDGLADPTIIGSLAGCNKAIARYSAKVK